MKKNYYNGVQEIKELAKLVHNLNESVMFNEEDEDIQQEPSFDVEGGEDVQADFTAYKSNYIDQVREITLKGMLELCKNPESEEYQTLQRIISICDKGLANKKQPDVQ